MLQKFENSLRRGRSIATLGWKTVNRFAPYLCRLMGNIYIYMTHFKLPVQIFPAHNFLSSSYDGIIGVETHFT